MAGNFYTIEEVAELLGKTEKEVHTLVQEGKIREFRDGTQLLFKKEEAEELKDEMNDFSISLDDLDAEDSTVGLAGDESTIGLADESSVIGLSPMDDSKSLDNEMSSMIELSEADTTLGGEGVNLLGDDDEFGPAADTSAETTDALSLDDESEEVDDIGRLDADVNLDSFGSGSGLLDLSLQADDTSLGAVLDDILPTAGGDEAGGAAIDEFDLDADAAPVFEDSTAEEAPIEAAEEAPMDEIAEPTPEPEATAAATTVTYVQVDEDPASNAFGSMLVVPLIALVLIAFFITAAAQKHYPSLLKFFEGNNNLFITLGLIVAALAVFGIGIAMSNKSPKKKA